MKVIVAGAGTLGRRVAQYVGEKHDVVIVEQSLERCASVTEEFRECGNIRVLRGDIDEPTVLLEAGVDRADVFVAATGDDEDNLVGCLLAKNEFKVKKVIGAVRNPRNRWLYNRSWGVDVALDSAQIVARLIEEEATLTDLVRLLDLREGAVTLTAITVAADSKLAGKAFAELSVAEGCHPVALLRGNDVLVPGEGVHLQADDALLVLAGPGAACQLDSIG